MSIYTGCASALVTPFNADGIDFEAYGRLIDYQIENRVDALCVTATTGEGSTMTPEEKRAVIAFAVERAAGRVPVIAGTGGNNTKKVIEESLAAEALGVDGLLIVTPYYNKASQSGLIAHYNAIADAVHTPIIVYNVPGRTGLNLLPATMKEIFKHENIVGIKEASGNIEQIVNLAAMCPGLDIYSGNDDHVLPLLALGGKGVISTVGNVIPHDMHDMCASFFAGDIKKAQELQFKILPVWKAAFCEVNPIPIKTMVSMMGIGNGELRLPLTPPSAENRAFLEKVMREYGLI
ncbi:MAG: 4-hydroxy-tetrahydrodipicolinate synthase [Clostridia bacterium]|nr:4-hydroxy-tetrahydrodipicolinate synthase [Clostridia bacterium]